MTNERDGYGAKSYSLNDVYRLTPMAADGSDCIADQMRLRATVAQRDDLFAACEALLHRHATPSACADPACVVCAETRAIHDAARAAISKAKDT